MTANSPLTYRCKLDACKVHKTGRCMEGVDVLEECSNILIETISDTPSASDVVDPNGLTARHDESGIESQQAADITEIANNLDGGAETVDGTDVEVADDDPIIPYDAEHDVILHSGEDLSPDDANHVSRERSVNSIVFVGPTDCGKTSLFSSIYSKFLEGPFAGCLFGGTDTMIGFERRAHDTRLASLRKEPYTYHTPRNQGLVFLHLHVRDEKRDRHRFDLLFVDRPGEDFLSIINDTDNISYLVELKAAKNIVIIVDGRRLADINERTVIYWQTLSLVKTLLQRGGLGVKHCVNVVLSKYDIVKCSPDKAEIENRFNDLFSDIENLLGSHVSSISRHIVAACPTLPKAKLDLGHGVAKLMRKWLRVPAPVRLAHQRRSVNVVTEFDKFGVRRRI